MTRKELEDYMIGRAKKKARQDAWMQKSAAELMLSVLQKSRGPESEIADIDTKQERSHGHE